MNNITHVLKKNSLHLKEGNWFSLFLIRNMLIKLISTSYIKTSRII